MLDCFACMYFSNRHISESVRTFINKKSPHFFTNNFACRFCYIQSWLHNINLLDSVYYIMSTNINIVLVKTSHPGNIGSTARAMKTMGLKKLTLVAPKNFPSEVADANAVGCKDILDQAKVVDCLGKSLLDSSLVIGFSARSRKSNVPSLTMDELFVTLRNYENDEVSIVFGNEQSGLSNEEVQLCNHIVCIPTDNAYTSLNLASAVQIFSYEYFKNFNTKDEPTRNHETQLATHSTKSHIIQMFLAIMSCLNIITNKNKKSLTQNVHIIFNKSKFSKNEADLLLGVLSSIEKALKK